MTLFKDSTVYLKKGVTVSTGFKATSARLQKVKPTKEITNYSEHNYSSEII